MTASDDAINRLDLLMHAQGHAFQATDNARIAHSELAEAPAGLATLALAVAQLADALSGVIDATAQGLSDEHGLDYGKDRDSLSE